MFKAIDSREAFWERSRRLDDLLEQIQGDKIKLFIQVFATHPFRRHRLFLGRG